MTILNLLRRRGSAPLARERLQILLSHERTAGSQPDLLAILHEEISSDNRPADHRGARKRTGADRSRRYGIDFRDRCRNPTFRLHSPYAIQEQQPRPYGTRRKHYDTNDEL